MVQKRQKKKKSVTLQTFELYPPVMYDNYQWLLTSGYGAVKTYTKTNKICFMLFPYKPL